MRLPWRRRADRFKEDAARAESLLDAVKADWERVRSTTARTRKERALNGFTSATMTLFSGRR